MSLRTAYKETAKIVPTPVRRPGGPRKPVPENITEKECTLCGRILPVERFYFSNGRYSSACRQCEQMRKYGGVSPNYRENIDAIQKASDFLTDTERVIEYSIEDVIETITAEFDRIIRIIDTETRSHEDLMKDPANKDALLKALERGAGQISQKIKDLAR